MEIVLVVSMLELPVSRETAITNWLCGFSRNVILLFAIFRKFAIVCQAFKTIQDDCQVGVSASSEPVQESRSCMLYFSSGKRAATNAHADLNLLLYRFCLSPKYQKRKPFGGKCNRCSAWLIAAPVPFERACSISSHCHRHLPYLIDKTHRGRWPCLRRILSDEDKIFVYAYSKSKQCSMKTQAWGASDM